MRNIANILAKLVRERDSSGDEMLVPSEYWKDFCKYFSYVYKFDDEELLYIRRHTYHLTSDIYQRYYFASDDYKALIIRGHMQFVEALDGFSYEETEYGIGVDGPYGKTSHDLLRYLGVLVDLKEVLRDGRPRQWVLEVGGGYGGLARCFLNFLSEGTYVICDLEETLFFSYTYLSLMLDRDRVHLLVEPLPQAALLPGHVYLVPQSKLSLLEKFSFDLAINQQSLQEMRVEQVHRYLDFVGRRSRRFYSCNLQSHDSKIVQAKGLVANLSDELRSRLGHEIWQGALPGPHDTFGDHIPGIDRLLFMCGGSGGV